MMPCEEFDCPSQTAGILLVCPPKVPCFIGVRWCKAFGSFSASKDESMKQGTPMSPMMTILQ